MRKRGIKNFDNVQIDYWAVGQVAPQFQGRRLLRAVSYFKGDVNELLRPADRRCRGARRHECRAGRGVRRHRRRAAPAAESGARREIHRRPRRAEAAHHHPAGRRELHDLGPGDPVAEVALPLHDASARRPRAAHRRLRGRGTLRPILYRASLSEMAVPYGDPDRNWRWRSAFDVGEYGMGRLASSDRDEHGRAVERDADRRHVCRRRRKSYVLPRAVGIYERDGGLLWKHYESYSKTNESRRARELVIFFIATIGNYDYSINWIFHQDGVLELDCGADRHHAAERRARRQGGRTWRRRASGHLVAANVVAPHHQHFFNFRLDFDVDGPANSVHEMNTRAHAGRRRQSLAERHDHGRDAAGHRSAGAAADEHGGGAHLVDCQPDGRRTRSAITRATFSCRA